MVSTDTFVSSVRDERAFNDVIQITRGCQALR